MDYNKDLKRKAEELSSIISKALVSVDPCGLIESGAPEDEYASLVGPIVGIILKGLPKSQTVSAVHNLLDREFDGGVSEDIIELLVEKIETVACMIDERKGGTPSPR